MSLKAIFFDVDGTFLDTTEYIYQAFEHTLSHHGMPKTRSELQKIMGKPLRECYRILAKMDAVEHLAQMHGDFQVENPHLSTPFQNTIKTLKQLKDKGYILVGISTRARSTLLQTLEQSAILPFLNLVIAIEDVTNPKPHPEPIEKALKHFRLKPSEAMMVGDSDVDVYAGKNAGVKTVGVTYGFHGKNITHAKPDYVIDDISEVGKIMESM